MTELVTLIVGLVIGTVGGKPAWGWALTQWAASRWTKTPPEAPFPAPSPPPDPPSLPPGPPSLPPDPFYPDGPRYRVVREGASRTHLSDPRIVKTFVESEMKRGHSGELYESRPEGWALVGSWTDGVVDSRLED